MKIKYLVKDKEELKSLEKEYQKLLKYYEIKSESGLEIESGVTSTIWIWPKGINSNISEIKRNSIECVVEEGEEFCERCGPIIDEEKTPYVHNIEIKGTRYHIKLKHRFKND